MLSFKSVKTQLILCLVSLGLFLAFKEKDGHFLFSLLIAVLAAAGTESLVLYLKGKALVLSASSAISGLIVGFVLSSDNPWWKIAFASLAVIISKYSIRFKGKHIFNPAALGIFLATIILGATTQWKGTYLWYILVPFGFYFIYRIRKIEVLIGYGAISFFLFGWQALLQHASPINILGYFSYFYVFVMLIEPKTTPVSKIGKYIFGCGAAVLIFILTGMGLRFDVELLSLLAMNMSVPFLNRLHKN